MSSKVEWYTMAMPPPPPRSLVFHCGGVEFVIRPGAPLLFGGIAAALDVTFLPVALPDQPVLAYHLAAVAITVLMIVTTLLHESGHALAYRAQGIWPVRVTLRGSGGACAAMVDEDKPGQALVRSLAGPAVTAVVAVSLFLAWRTLPLPPLWRLVAATLTVFSAFDLVFNTLPVHPRCDGAHALRAAVWLLRGCEPAPFAVLYVWRPIVLAAAVLLCPAAGALTGLLPTGPVVSAAAGACALALCAVPLGALALRALRGRGLASAPTGHAAS